MEEKNNLKELKIALGRQVSSIQKTHDKEKRALEDKIKAIEKDRAYLQAKTSIATAKINREYRKRLEELDTRERVLHSREAAIAEREKKIARQLDEKEEIIQKLNVRSIETESGLTAEFNQKLRSKEWEIQSAKDENKILEKTIADGESRNRARLEALEREIRGIKEKHKAQILSLTSDFAVERGTAEREKYTLQQNIKALKNTIAAMREQARKTSVEYEDKLKEKAISSAEAVSQAANRAEEAALENENLRREIDEVRSKTSDSIEAIKAEYDRNRQKLNSRLQAAVSEAAGLKKSVSDLKELNESLKDNYERKITGMEDASRAVEVELRNRLAASAAELERFEKTQKSMTEKFTAKIAELEEYARSLEKDVEKEKNKQGELENKYSAQYLTLADEKRHMGEMYDREIASLKEALLERTRAMSSMEAAASREKANLQIEISSLRDSVEVQTGKIHKIQAEASEKEREKDSEIASLNKLIGDREKEAAERFAEVSSRVKLLEQRLASEQESFGKTLESKDGEIAELARQVQDLKVDFSIRASALEGEKKQLRQEMENRIKLQKEELEAANSKLREQEISHAEALRDRDNLRRESEDALRGDLSEKDGLIERVRDDAHRKLAEKDEQYSAEIDRLRRTILQNSQEAQREKDALAEKISAGESKLSEVIGVHKKEIEGLNALRESERNSLRNTIAGLNEKISRLSAEGEEREQILSSRVGEIVSLKSKIQNLLGEKRNIAQSLNTLLSGKQETIDEQSVLIERMKDELSEMMRRKEEEEAKLIGEINRLSSIKSGSDEKLRGEIDALEKENDGLKEEIIALKDSLSSLKAEAGKQNEVLMIEKNAEVNKLKALVSSLRSDLQTMKSEGRISRDELKKHYEELLDEKEKTAASSTAGYEQKIAEFRTELDELKAELSDKSDASSAALNDFESEKRKLAKVAEKNLAALRNEYEEKITRISAAMEAEKEKRELAAREAAARKIEMESRREQLSKRLAQIKLQREKEFSQWQQQRAELMSQLKMQDLRMKEEEKKYKASFATANDEIAILRAQLTAAKREYETGMRGRQEDFRKEISSLRDALDREKARAEEIYKTSSEEKEALAEDFAGRVRRQEDAYNKEKIKMTADLNDLRDINRALEEELSAIRARLETFKGGMRE